MKGRRVRTVIVFVALLAGAVLGAAPGCGDNIGIIYPCDYPIIGRLASNDERDACCMIDPCPGHCINAPCPKGTSPDGGLDATIADGASASCSGDCAPIPPDGWSQPQLLWIGPEGTAPVCPDSAPSIAYQGHADLVALAGSCATCACSPSSGRCSPPPHLTASTLPCNDGGGVTTSFDGPAAWDGTCTDAGAIPAGKLCNGVACAGSLNVAALGVYEQGCGPSTVGTPDFPPPSWTNDVLACQGTLDPPGACDDHGQTCVPAASPPAFLMCIYQQGDNVCPVTYPDKHLVYAAFTDTRACTDCTCGAAAGSSCSATLSLFADGACATALLLPESISSTGPSCFALPAGGPALGSKAVTALAYQPGACAPSGGEASGSVDPSGASTFCCLVA